MYTVSLDAAGLLHQQRIGSKALQLARLLREKIRVPQGFVITAHSLDRFLTANRLQDDWDSPDLCERIEQADIPSDLQADIASAYLKLQHAIKPSLLSVAVRSSASAEDLPEASFAGQYETVLNVNQFSHLLTSIKRCWGSMFSPRVRQYAAQKQISLASFPMGILVQQMIDADVSGVVFSINPVTHNRDELVINASYGLGEAIVAGHVTPDCFFVNKATQSIQKELGQKELKIIPGKRETVERETTRDEQSRFCLSDEQIELVAAETARIEALYQQPVDIEFAIKDGLLYILQVRPITT